MAVHKVVCREMVSFLCLILITVMFSYRPGMETDPHHHISNFNMQRNI